MKRQPPGGFGRDGLVVSGFGWLNDLGGQGDHQLFYLVPHAYRRRYVERVNDWDWIPISLFEPRIVLVGLT